MTTRFRVDEAFEVLRDPGGHQHHWTVLVGVLEEGTLRLGDAMAIPRVGGDFWLGRIIGFDRFGETFGESVGAATAAGRPLGVAVWGVAPPQGTVARGDARVVAVAEARAVVARLRVLEPRALDHCPDCRRVARLEAALT